MKTLLSIALLLSLFKFSFAQTTIIEETTLYKITKHQEVYTILDKKSNKEYLNLKFVKRIARFYQVLDADNNIFYFNHEFEIKEQVEDFFFVCGTVPHYQLEIKEENKQFVIMEDETFYDHNNAIPAKILATVAKSKVDDLYFINGEKTFRYTSNFNIEGIFNLAPNAVIFKKGSKYGLLDAPEKLYDSISFYGQQSFLTTTNNQLIGVYGIIEPKFKSIAPFNYYLAETTLPNGVKGFIDSDGNEY